MPPGAPPLLPDKGSISVCETPPMLAEVIAQDDEDAGSPERLNKFAHGAPPIAAEWFGLQTAWSNCSAMARFGVGPCGKPGIVVVRSDAASEECDRRVSAGVWRAHAAAGTRLGRARWTLNSSMC